MKKICFLGRSLSDLKRFPKNVMHAFHKKTLKTRPQDVAMIRQRYQQLIQEFSS